MTVEQTLASPPPEPFRMEGGCGCGYLRYRLENKPIVVHCCHCTSCQRETGTAFALNALIEASCVTSLPSTRAMVPASPGRDALVAGPALFSPEEEAIAEPVMTMTPSASQSGQNIARCPKCRVAIWSNYPRAGPLFRFVRVGTLDEAWKLNPDAHIFTRSKRSFVQLDASVPQYEISYPDRESIWGKEGIERWERARQGGQ